MSVLLLVSAACAALLAIVGVARVMRGGIRAVSRIDEALPTLYEIHDQFRPGAGGGLREQVDTIKRENTLVAQALVETETRVKTALHQQEVRVKDALTEAAATTQENLDRFHRDFVEHTTMEERASEATTATIIRVDEHLTRQDKLIHDHVNADAVAFEEIKTKLNEQS